MEKHDVVVIGGGPAGIFAAGFAAQRGARVLLLEKNPRCGAKVLLTGKGRCNLSNDEEDPYKFAAHFGTNGKAFLTALYTFGVQDLVNFFADRGLKLQVERGARIFPAAGSAKEVQKVLDQFLRDSGVTLLSHCRVQSLTREGDKITSVITSRGEFFAERFVVATGGLSYPGTGCTGDGYRWAKETGHELVDPEPALVSVHLAEDWTAELCEFNLKNVQVTVFLNGKKIAERFGEAFFTRSGIGGPIILDLSAKIRDGLKKGAVILSLDMKPAVAGDTFDKRLQREFAVHSNRDFRNSLGNLLPKDMIPLFIRLSQIDPEKKCHSISRNERQRLLKLFKDMELTVSGVGGFEKAIVTSGGVSLKDIDMRSMCSKKISNLYFVGEVIDLDGPTGGFNLQVCWSTGFLAAGHLVPDLE